MKTRSLPYFAYDFRCPKCSARMSLTEDEYHNRTFDCPSCNASGNRPLPCIETFRWGSSHHGRQLDKFLKALQGNDSIQLQQTTSNASQMSINNLIRFSKAEGWAIHQSTPQRRILFMDGDTPIGFAQIGTVRIPLLFREFNRLAFVTIGPHRETIPRKVNFITKDGIALVGEIAVEFNIAATDLLLEQFALNPTGQYAAFCDRVVASTQRVLANHTYTEFDAFRSNSGKSIVADFITHNSDNACSLTLTNLHLQALDAANAQLRESRLKMKQLEETEQLHTRQAELAMERAEYEARRKLAETKNQIEIRRLEETNQLDIEEKRKQQAIEHQQKKAQILSTEEGQMSEDMKIVFSYKEKQLEVQKIVAQLSDNQARDVLKAVLSHQSGANSVLRAIAANQIGIKFSDDTVLADSLTKLTVEADEGESPSQKPDVKKQP